MNGLTFDILNKNKTTLLKRGFLPIPAHPGSKHPMGKWKTYTISDWNKTLKLVSGVRANIGILTGQKSGIICVDVDNKPPSVSGAARDIYSANTGMRDWEMLCSKNGGVPGTLSCSTPSGGRHFYFLWDEELAEKVKTTNSKVVSLENGCLCAIDIRGDGGFIMCPPSVTSPPTATSTGRYMWMPSDKISEVPILPMPQWLKENIIGTLQKDTKKIDDKHSTRNFTLPFANEAVTTDDFELFCQSKYFRNHVVFKIDVYQRIILTETEDFDCEICNRTHVHHSNHPFLVRHGDRLLFVCRPSIGDNHFTALVEKQDEKKDEDTEGKEENDTPHYMLIKELWKVAKEERLQKHEGYIYKPVPKKPCAYRQYMDYNKFINKVLARSKIFKSNVKRFQDLLSHLKLYDDEELPFMERDMNMLAFSNGVLLLDTLNFVKYYDDMQGKVARHYIDQHFNGKTYTPTFDKLVMFQLSHLEEEEQKKVYEIVLALMGRTFFKSRRHDLFTVLLFLYGESDTGKSTIMRIIQAFHPSNTLGVISANNEKTFGLEALMDKDLVVIPEMPHNMANVLDCTIFQQMIDGDVVTVPGKHRKTSYGNFEAPMVGAGNKFPNYEDKKGAIPRRLATVHFKNFIVQRDNTMERRIIENELPNLILKCLKAYWKLVKENQTKDFWDVAPEYFHETRELARTHTNWLYRFLTTSPDDNKSTTAKYYCRKRVLPEKDRIMTSIQDVKKSFVNFMKFNHPGEKIVWDDGDHTTFKSLGYEISEVNTCRACNQKAKGGKEKCCDGYSKANRSKRTFVLDLEIVCETLTEQKEEEQIDEGTLYEEVRKEVLRAKWAGC